MNTKSNGKSRLKSQTKLLIVSCVIVGGVNSTLAQTWTQTSAPTTQAWAGLASSADGSTLLAVGQTAVYTSTNSGVGWTPVRMPNYEDLWQAAAVSANGVTMAAGDYGDIYISTNSGLTWWQSTNAPQDYWFSMACSADGTKMVAAPCYDTATGNGQPLYLSTNSGITWTAALVPSNSWTSVASSADGTKLIASAFNGPIYVSTNSGLNWTSNNLVAYWRSVACSADGMEVVAVADPAGDIIYRSTNSGVAWSPLYISGMGSGFASVATSSDGKRLLAVGRGSGGEEFPIYVSTNSGRSWSPQTNSSPTAFWNAVICSADGYKMFAVTYGFNDYAGGIYTLQTMPLPQLKSAFIGASIVISWTVPSTNFVLQQNVDLSSTNWLTLTNVPLLNITNLQNQIVLLPTNKSAFYRLSLP